MKATELMVGDYIMFNGSPYIIEEISGKGWVHILDIKNKARVALSSDYILDFIEGIPLTEEILEKNGFYFGYTTNEMDIASNTIAQLPEEYKGWVWDEGDGAIKVIFPNEADGGMIQLDDQSFDRSMTFVFAENIYVHELQHALKLCRISKEIIL